MKILFFGVFKDTSTNVSQSAGLRKLGIEVIDYNYRGQNDDFLINKCKEERPDLVIFSKCNEIGSQVVDECNKISKTCMWYIDPINYNWNDRLREKIGKCSFTCCAKEKAVELGKKNTDKIIRIIEGFDPKIDYPRNLTQDIDVSFIGNMYNNRNSILKPLGIQIFNDAYTNKHAEVVSRSKININLCTNRCESDRVYKILAAGGFLLTDQWDGIIFKDRIDLVIFNTKEELKEKIDYYLNNSEEREKIRIAGRTAVQKYSRDNWAKQLMDYYEHIK